MSPWRRGSGLLAAVAVAALAVDLAVALVLAPEAANFSAPRAQRLFYVHVPAALAAYAAFAVAVAGSAQYLRTRQAGWDALGASAAEVGALLTTIALLTGVVWSRVEFFSAGAGQGFAFALLADPKFVTTAALWLVFLGYLALRRHLDDPEARARLGAVYALLGSLAVPLSYLSSRFSPHPDFLAPGSGLAPGLAAWLAVAVACWLAIMAALLVTRLRLARALADLEETAPAPPAPGPWGERA